MKKLLPALMILAASACGPAPNGDPGAPPAPSRTGGAGPSQGTGGSPPPAPAATGGMPAPSGTGGSVPAGTGGTPAGTGGAPATPDAAPTPPTPPADAAPTPPPPGAGAYAPCPNCKPLFDGKNLDQWDQGAAGAWVIKDGAMASTGKPNDIWTKEDFGAYRIFFTLRQIRGNHQPGVLFFGSRPAAGGKPARGLAGIQVQPPNGYTWDYRPGKNNNGSGLFMKLPAPRLNVNMWSQCEVLVKTTGELRYACCQMTGTTPCKATESLRFKDPTTANKKGPFGIQMHNGGLFDEYKDIYVETDPAVDDLLSTK